MPGSPRPAKVLRRHQLARLEHPPQYKLGIACYCLEGLAACCIAQQVHLPEAVALLAAAASARAKLGAQLTARELEVVQHATAEARRLLPDEDGHAVATGSAMAINEAMHYALAVR